MILAGDPDDMPADWEATRQRYFNINWIQLATTWATFALFLVALISLNRCWSLRLRSSATTSRDGPLPLLARPGTGRLAGYLRRHAPGHPPRPPEADGGSLPGLSADFEALRWFVLPRECLPG